MKFFPSSALVQLEFNKVQELLAAYCKTEFGKAKAGQLRIHTRKEFIHKDFLQRWHMSIKYFCSLPFLFPADFTQNIAKELKLLGIAGATLGGAQFMQIRKLLEHTAAIFRWFSREQMVQYTGLYNLIEHSYYEKEIIKEIDAGTG